MRLHSTRPVAPNLTVAYHLTDTAVIYGSTGLGFKPGGFSAHIDPPASPRFGTETAWANELGLKSSWLDGKVTANLALFYYDISDYQVEQFTPSGFNFTTVNAPSARSLGAEAELTARPLPGLEISALGGYTDARLARYTDPFTGMTVHNTHPPFVADFNSGLAGQYRHHTGLFGRVQYAAFGCMFFDAVNTPSLEQKAYGLLSARLGFAGKRFGIYLFGDNLTDTAYFTKKIPPLNAGAPGWPRVVGVTAEVNY